MMTVELAERPDLKTTGIDAKPEAFAVPQALSLPPQALAQNTDPFEAYNGAQPSDRGYDEYWLDLIEP